jgi:hypothetical protein
MEIREPRMPTRKRRKSPAKMLAFERQKLAVVDSFNRNKCIQKKRGMNE